MEESRLYRSKSDSVIAGICGGLGKHLNIDPILIRILFVVALLVGGSGLLVYIILWIVIPEEPDTLFGQKNYKTEPMNEETNNNNNQQSSTQDQKKQNKKDGSLWGGVILIAIGGMFLIDRFVPRIDFDDLWPVILIVVGGILISKAYRQNKS